MFDCDIMSSDKKYFMKKADIYLISAILAIALIILLIFRLTSTQGSYANISYDGMAVMQIPLVQSETQYYLLTESVPSSYGETQPVCSIEVLSEEEWLNIRNSSEGEWLNIRNSSSDYNVLLCRNGEVRMIESSCPDQICVHHRAICATGENIICLPHKIVIEIINDEESKLDGVAY